VSRDPSLIESELHHEAPVPATLRKPGHNHQTDALTRSSFPVAAVFGTTLLIAGCLPSDSQAPPPSGRPAPPPAFLDVARERGLDAVHDPTGFGHFEMPEIMGAGGALCDFNSDGLLDVYVVVGGRAESGLAGGRLFLQRADGTFRDETTASGLSPGCYGMGAYFGDVDDDGFPDLLLTNYGPDELWRNAGDGTFVNVTRTSGITAPGWSTAACFCDYDRDSHLDLLVVGYVDYTPGQRCEDGAGRPDYCGPNAFQGTVDRLFHNGGEDGAPLFTDHTVRSGLAENPGKGLGVVCGDLTGDGRPDFYVANDMEPNHFWVQQSDGTFLDEAHLNGTALNQLGEAEAGMGVLAADLFNDGRLALFVTHLRGQTNTLYVPSEGGAYRDATATSGLGPPSLPYTGFGVAAVDIDHNGQTDLLIANGRVKRAPRVEGVSPSTFADYAEPNLVFLNTGNGRFENAPAAGGEFTAHLDVHRGLSTGDVDNDGDVDLLVTNCAGPVRLYRNDVAKSGNWLLVRLLDTHGNRQALGAQVMVELADATLMQLVCPSAGYLTSSDVRQHYGLGKVDHYQRIVVDWSDGSREEFPGGPANHSLTIQRGRGKYVGGSLPQPPGSPL
jgi:hypothetical protein